MLFTNAYQDDEEGNENRLKFWFNLDEWSLDEAALIFLDLDPDSLVVLKDGGWSYFVSFSGKFNVKYDADANGFPIPIGLSKDELMLFLPEKEANMIDILQSMFNDHKRLLGRLTRAKPHEWIDIALEKKISIPWLKWATEQEFYTPKTTVKQDKSLGNTERDTLLIVIAALAKEAKVDINKISKAGDLIANMTQLIGAPIGATTIETHLKKIPTALQSRAK